MDHYKLFIDGEFVEAQGGATFESFDPGTGLPFATVAQAGAAEAEAPLRPHEEILTVASGAG